MATSIYCALLLLAVCGALPLQQRSPRGPDYSNYEEEVKVIFPDSFNEALPNIQGLQREMVSLMNKTLISQENVENKLGNNEIVSLMNKTLSVVDKTENHLENIAASQNESIVLYNMTLKSQELIKTQLQHMEEILPDIQDSQNDMVSLMNKTLSAVDKTEIHLENIAASQNKLIVLNNMTLKSQHLLETHLQNMEEILPDIQDSQNDMVSLMNKSLDIVGSRLHNLHETVQDLGMIMNNTQITQESTVERLAKHLDNQHASIVNILTEMTQIIYRGLLPARDCSDIAAKGLATNGPVQVITPSDGLGSILVYCDFTEEGAWTVFQRRYEGSVDFYRSWTEYENGFGDANGEYWLGLKNIHRLISDGSAWALRIDLESFDGESAYAIYDRFSISNGASNYRLAVGKYSGTAGDSLKDPGDSYAVLNGMQFSTFDRENDRSSINCASYYQGAFWYNACYRANLNGKYLGRAGTDDWKGMIWYTWKQKQSLKTSQMSIRRVL